MCLEHSNARIPSSSRRKIREPERSDESADEDCEPPVAKKCRRSVPAIVVTRKITEYSAGKREGPGVLPRVWLEFRKLEKHPLLLVPWWSGFNIKVSDRVVVVVSTISYLDTIDSPATDPEDRAQELSRGCAIKKIDCS